MTRRLSLSVLVVLGCLSLTCTSVFADVYADVAVKDLTFIAGSLDHPPLVGAALTAGSQSLAARVVMDGSANAYLTAGAFGAETLAGLGEQRLVIRGDAAGTFSGTIFAGNDNLTAMAGVRFTVNNADHACSRQDFLKGQLAYYERQWQAGLPGAAWFRQRARATRKELGADAPPDANNGNEQLAASMRESDLDETFGFFSGGRAVGENLQLDRALSSTTQPSVADVKTADIQGITVREFDWKPLVKDLHPQTDPLAAIIPADQHAIFLPSFAACTALVDRADQQFTPFMPMIESASGDAQTQKRYERQLCLSMTELGRLLGPSLIDSVVITGSDPYWRVGSDIAIVFQPKDAKALSSLILAQQTLRRARESDASPANGEIAGISYTGLVNSDRTVCSYLATIGPAVVVTNSLVQIEKLAAVQQGKAPALATMPEYLFFRDRYRLGEAKETALLVLSDQTIRRWSSPRWRIADSRRTRALAVMSDVQAEHAREIALGNVEAATIKPDRFVPGLAELNLQSRGVFSPTFGSLSFMTPIAELKMDTVTREEEQAYERWRTGYESNFRRFDPIAVRASLDETSVGVDMTVMPLVIGSDYRDAVEICAGAKLGPASGDPHDALAQIAAAINPKSQPIVSLTNMAGAFGGRPGVDLFGWVGHSISLYADDDGFWDELAKADDADKFWRMNIGRTPVALYVESSNPLKLAVFLTAVHAMVDQSAPNLATWETLKYGEQAYVKITPAAGIVEEAGDFAICYAALPRALIISLNEGVLKRAIDREMARTARATTAPADAATTTAPATQPVAPWLGESYSLHLSPRITQVIQAGRKEMQSETQRMAWQNIPILNEFKHLLPDLDPAEMYERVFGIELVDGGGGKYEWDAKWQTVRSTVYGSPAEPKDGPTLLDSIKGMGGNFGVTFENSGLRGRAQIDLEPRTK